MKARFIQYLGDGKFNTASGRPEPGDLYYATGRYLHAPDGHCWIWNDCRGPHLIAVCPNGQDWDIDSRASNCTMPDDKDHRCWVRTGNPEDGTLTVGKTGRRTCGAGAGSILIGDYHGFLRNGTWERC